MKYSPIRRPASSRSGTFGFNGTTRLALTNIFQVLILIYFAALRARKRKPEDHEQILQFGSGASQLPFDQVNQQSHELGRAEELISCWWKNKKPTIHWSGKPSQPTHANPGPVRSRVATSWSCCSRRPRRRFALVFFAHKLSQLRTGTLGRWGCIHGRTLVLVRWGHRRSQDSGVGPFDQNDANPTGNGFESGKDVVPWLPAFKMHVPILYLVNIFF